MALQSSGQIRMSQIATEFGSSMGLGRNLSGYYRGGALVRTTTVNARIPTSGMIKYSDFYGAVKYVGGATIKVIAETYSKYQTNNDGKITVTVTGNSPSYTVTWPGPNGQTRVMYSGQSYTVGGYDQSFQATIKIADTANPGGRNFGPYLIGFGGATMTYGPFTL